MRYTQMFSLSFFIFIIIIVPFLSVQDLLHSYFEMMNVYVIKHGMKSINSKLEPGDGAKAFAFSTPKMPNNHCRVYKCARLAFFHPGSYNLRVSTGFFYYYYLSPPHVCLVVVFGIMQCTIWSRISLTFFYYSIINSYSNPNEI